jgi:hypothetical protein
MTVHFEGEDLFLVRGTLTEVQHAKTTVNLLAQVEKHLAAKSLASGVLATAGEMYGVLANSAAVALYDGEDTYNFAALLDGSVVCGTFESANSFVDGDVVRAVVSKRGDVLYVHGLLREGDKMLFMPMQCAQGTRALLTSCMRTAWRLCWIGWISFAVIGLFVRMPAAGFVMALVGMPALVFPMEYWTFRGARHMGDRAAAIFSAFGFANPQSVDLLPHLTVARAPGNVYRNLVAYHSDRAGLA